MTPSFSTRQRVICSVSPFKLPRLDRPYAPNPKGGMSVYEVAPYTLEDRNKRSQPFLVPISDCFQAQRDVWQGQGYPGQHTTPNFISVDLIASDILTHWCQGRLGAPAESGPGVWLAEHPAGPTDNETTAAFARQDMYMSYLYEKALEYHNNKMLIEISKDHRISANWLGKDEIWSKTGAELAKDRCPFCQSIVPTEAYVCATCSRTIREMPPELARLSAIAMPVGPSSDKSPRPTASR